MWLYLIHLKGLGEAKEGRGGCRVQEVERERQGGEREQSWCLWERYDAVFIGPVFVCMCVCVHRRVKPPRDPIVISVINTNMFIVLLCPIGGKDPIIIM